MAVSSGSWVRKTAVRLSGRIFDALASIELAVFIILAIAAISAVGTFVEAKHSTEVASLVVYRNPLFTAVLVLFILNLLFAALSRWPWKRSHIGFLVTHLGLIVILVGSLFTRVWGIDGVVAMGPNETATSVRMPQNFLNVFVAKEGGNYERLLSEHLEFNPLRSFRGHKDWNLTLPNGESASFKLLDWWPYALRKVGVKNDPTLAAGIPAVRFLLNSTRANLDEWLFLNGIQGSTLDMGPAHVRFQKGALDPKSRFDKKTIVIHFLNDKDETPMLTIFDGEGKPPREFGRLEYGKAVPVGWMDFTFTLEEFYHKASPLTEYEKTGKRKDSVEAIQVAMGDEVRWLELGASIQILRGKDIFFIQYVPLEIPLGFTIGLENFKVQYYQGSRQPMSYESRVFVQGPGDFRVSDVLIKMNEPLHHQGFTFYQSSYSVDAEGKPAVSVLSVNWDPGRWTKYIGCLLLVGGIILMFYFRPVYSGRSRFLKSAVAGAKEGT